MSNRRGTEIVTREQIAEDVEAFLQAGGRIEVIPDGVSGEQRREIRNGLYTQSGPSIIKESLKKQRERRYKQKAEARYE